jgi:hypothetical protein
LFYEEDADPVRGKDAERLAYSLDMLYDPDTAETPREVVENLFTFSPYRIFEVMEAPLPAAGDREEYGVAPETVLSRPETVSCEIEYLRSRATARAEQDGVPFRSDDRGHPRGPDHEKEEEGELWADNPGAFTNMLDGVYACVKKHRRLIGLVAGASLLSIGYSLTDALTDEVTEHFVDEKLAERTDGGLVTGEKTTVTGNASFQRYDATGEETRNLLESFNISAEDTPFHAFTGSGEGEPYYAVSLENASMTGDDAAVLFVEELSTNLTRISDTVDTRLEPGDDDSVAVAAWPLHNTTSGDALTVTWNNEDHVVYLATGNPVITTGTTVQNDENTTGKERGAETDNNRSGDTAPANDREQSENQNDQETRSHSEDRNNTADSNQTGDNQTRDRQEQESQPDTTYFDEPWHLPHKRWGENMSTYPADTRTVTLTVEYDQSQRCDRGDFYGIQGDTEWDKDNDTDEIIGYSDPMYEGEDVDWGWPWNQINDEKEPEKGLDHRIDHGDTVTTTVQKEVVNRTVFGKNITYHIGLNITDIEPRNDTALDQENTHRDRYTCGMAPED